jgi:predicted nucleotidyltransferase
MFGLEPDDLAGIIRVISQNPKIEEIVLFGSRAKGSYHSGSDIDLALKGKNLQIDDILDASIRLDELELPFKMDLILFERISEQALIDHINRVGVLIYSNSI